MRKCNDAVYQLAKDQALVKKLKNKRFRPFCVCLSGVMFVTRGSKTLFFLPLIIFPTWIVVNDIIFWICQSLPMSAPATQSVDSRARASFS